MDNTTTLPASFSVSRATYSPNALLKYSAQTWFITAWIGLLIFAYYVVMFYAVSLAKGDLEHWNSFLAKGYIAGDIAHNIAFGLHVMLAIIIIIGGPLQLVPKVRELAPKFHRWNGRVFVTCVLLVTTMGLYIKFTSVNYGETINGLSNVINALLIYYFCFRAIKYVMAGNIIEHRKWMMRLFIASYAVWFFRIGLMFWLLVHQKPVGFDVETFKGPFLIFLVFAQYLIPLAVLEGYFYAQQSTSSIIKNIVSSILVAASIITALGLFSASMILWFPNT